MSALGRIRQGLAGLVPRQSPELAECDRALVTPALERRFRDLPAYDQVHLIAVTGRLRELGATDADLLRAGLLHDIGKRAYGRSVRLPDRVAYVLVSALSPELAIRLATLPARRWRLGFALAHHHPAIGAALIAEHGGSERTCWLIRHHADRPIPSDPDLRLLVNADEHFEAD